MWLALGAEDVKICLTVSKRRSARLQVTSEGDVDVRMPLGTSRSDVVEFVFKHQAWVEERRAAVKTRDAEADTGITLYGETRPFVASALGEFLVTETQVWIPEAWSREQRDNALDRWQRDEARRCFSELIEHWWPHFQQPGRERPVLRVKKMRTRWGSLSRKGYINLNLALLALPMDLIELVVVHELCHLDHFDHGPGFKRRMSECLPDWRVRDKAINQAGLNLL